MPMSRSGETPRNHHERHLCTRPLPVVIKCNEYVRVSRFTRVHWQAYFEVQGTTSEPPGRGASSYSPPCKTITFQRCALECQFPSPGDEQGATTGGTLTGSPSQKRNNFEVQGTTRGTTTRVSPLPLAKNAQQPYVFYWCALEYQFQGPGNHQGTTTRGASAASHSQR